MTIKSLRQIKQLKNKAVLLRVDFNVPMFGKKIRENYKITSSLPTIEYLLKKGARVILITHLGRPDGRAVAEFSLAPVVKELNKLMKARGYKKKVHFVPAVLGPKAKKARLSLLSGEILMLENLRFEKGEEKNDEIFAKELAGGADLLINDAFAVSHREQASVAAIKKYLPAYAGFLLEEEVRALSRVLKPKQPLVSVMGGAKVSDKKFLLEKLYKKSHRMLVGGALANNFLAALGFEVGISLVDKESTKFAKKFIKRGKIDPKIILPREVVVVSGGQAKVKAVEAIGKKDKIVDIGPAAITAFAEEIKTAATLIWNGPMGQFEEKRFSFGTLAIGRLIAARSNTPAWGVVGGGETVEAIKLTKMEKYIDWVSTGGGAMLSFLGGEKMPGLSRIVGK